MTTTYYQYNPVFSDWTGIGTENTGYATSEHVPVSVGAGLTQTWTGSGWSTTTDYRGTYYYVSNDYENIGTELDWLNPNYPPSVGIATTSAPPAVPASGFILTWDGTSWVLREIVFRGQILSDLSSGISSFHDVNISGVVTATRFSGDGSTLTDVSADLVETDSTSEAGVKYITFARNNSTGVGQTLYTNTGLKYNASTNQITLGGGLLASSLTATTLYNTGSGNISIVSNLVPSADNTYELGSVANRWKDIYLDEGQSVLNIGDVGIGVTDGHLVIDGREALDLDTQGDIGGAGRLRNVYLTGIVTAYNAGIVTYYGDGSNLDLPVTSGGGGAIATKYKSSSNTTMSDPGKGKWRLNNLTQSNATQMAVDVITEGGYNINALLSQITAGTKIFLQRKDKPEAYFTFIVNTAPTLQGTTSDGWYLFSSITNLRNGGTGISDKKDCVLAFKAPNQVDGESITPSSVALGDGGPSWTHGTGTPEGAVTAPVGSLYSRTDGGAGTTLYVKESGTGNTGWAAK